ncbi:serine/threonine-protein kinase pim-1-like, partial [Silurus meridionalis]
GVFHRDIKAENVLLNPLTLQVKLIDFGLGVLHKDTTYTEHAGTDIYIPPECYVDKEYEAEPFTVWGLGVLSYILLCRMQPFDGEKEIVEGHLFIPDELSKASQDFIGWCLQRDPNSRPTLNQILGHHWFR